MRRPTAFCAALLAAVISSTPAWADSPVPTPPHVLPSLGAHAAAAEPPSWIVGARPGSTVPNRLASRYGAKPISERGAFVVAREQAREFATALREAGVYAYAEPNELVHRSQDPTPVPTPVPDEWTATDWRAFLIPSTLLAPAVEAAPLTAIIDSPIDVTHPELAGMQAAGDPTVVNLHGTAVASVIAGRANGFGMVGVFPGAPLLAIGSGLRLADLTAAIATAVKANARVINMSFGSQEPSYAMFVELAFAVSKGVLPVAAAGNEFQESNPVEYPAAFPHVLSISSIGSNGASSEFSTANGAVDLAAPGESVLAAVPVAHDADGVPDGYQRVAGTSFASPIVAGTAAWLMTTRPNLNGEQIADLMRRSAVDVDRPGWDNNTGYGVVNLAGALAQPDPPRDSMEVNDDIEWVNGTRFSKADPVIRKVAQRTRTVSGKVDAWKDRADVYRIEIGARKAVKVTLRTGPNSNPDLAAFNSKAKTIWGKARNRLDYSFRGTGKTETMTVRNRNGRLAFAYVAVYSPDIESAVLDAYYTLTIKRA